MGDTKITLTVDASQVQEWLAEMGPVYTAAPDLREALQGLVSACGAAAAGDYAAKQWLQAAIKIAVGALAKAEGRS